MIIIHFTKIAPLYPRVAISSLAKQLEKPPFYHSYTSFGVWPRDHYMPLQRSTTGVCHALLQFPEQTVPACSAKVSRTNVPSCTMWERRFTKYDAIPHPTKQDTLPIVLLISRQAIPYRTRGGTCCLGVSTSKIRSLADLSTTCHGGINHLHHSNHCSNHSIDPLTVNSYLDGWDTTTLSQRHKPNSTSQRMESPIGLSRLLG
jgi:hypothetical protein